MKTAISLPDPLFEAADRLAARLGISRSQLFQRALQLLLDRHEGADVTAALNKVYDRPGRDHELDKTLARMQSASLPKDDW
jgi:metal-responsive CopG/Arc/MetJ family transcriptional regulator